LLSREVHDKEAKPASKHTESRVRARKHEGNELEPVSEEDPVQQRAVQDQRNGNGGVKQAESIKKEESSV
jgi:hypothetical protein